MARKTKKDKLIDMAVSEVLTTFASVAELLIALRNLRNLKDSFGIEDSEVIERLQKTPLASTMQDSEEIEDLLSTLNEMYDAVGADITSKFFRLVN